MKTFTNYAEKKAKQFLNLLQGYTKGIRMTAILILLLMGVNSAWAYTLYLYTGSFGSWNDSNAKFQVYTNKNINATSLGNNWYSFDVGTFTGTAYIKRMDSSNSSKWNEFSASISSTNNITRVTGWNAGIVADGLYLAGDNWGDIGSWSTNDADGKMTISSGTIFASKTFTGITASAHEFKIAFKGTWDNAIGHNGKVSCVNGTQANNSGNIKFTPYIAGDVTITYDVSTGNIVITCPAPTITFDPEGGSGGTSTQSAPYGDATSKITAPTKTGYTFEGYYTGDNGTGTQIIGTDGNWIKSKTDFTDANNKWIVTSNKTLYAKWTANTYTITYEDQGGGAFSGTHATGYPTTHTYGTATTLKTATKSGYTFNGWFTTSGCTGSAVTSLGATTYTANITLYAKWTANEPLYNVDIKAEEGGSVSQTEVSVNESITEEIMATPNEGYKFIGWTTDGGAQVTDKDIVSTINSSTTTVSATSNGIVIARFEKLLPAMLTLTQKAIYKTTELNWAGGSGTEVAPYKIYSEEVVRITATELPAVEGLTAHYKFGELEQESNVFDFNNISSSTATKINVKAYYKKNGTRHGDEVSADSYYFLILSLPFYVSTVPTGEMSIDRIAAGENILVQFRSDEKASVNLYVQKDDETDSLLTTINNSASYDYTYEVPNNIEPCVLRFIARSASPLNGRTFEKDAEVALYKNVTIKVNDPNGLMNKVYLWRGDDIKSEWPGESFAQNFDTWRVFVVKYPYYDHFVLNDGTNENQTFDEEIPSEDKCYQLSDTKVSEGGYYNYKLTEEPNCPSDLMVSDIKDVTIMEGEQIVVMPEVLVGLGYKLSDVEVEISNSNTNSVRAMRSGTNITVLGTSEGSATITVTYTLGDESVPMTFKVTVEKKNSITIQVKVPIASGGTYDNIGWSDNSLIKIHYWFSSGTNGDIPLRYVYEEANKYKYMQAEVPLDANGKTNFLIGYNDINENWEKTADITNVTTDGCYTLKNAGYEKSPIATRSGDVCWDENDYAEYQVKVLMQNGKTYLSNITHAKESILSFFAPGKNATGRNAGVVMLYRNGKVAGVIDSNMFDESNVYVAQVNEDGISLTNVVPYTGNYYIRTWGKDDDISNKGTQSVSTWTADEKKSRSMTFFISREGEFYNHYWVQAMAPHDGGKDVSAWVANEYNDDIAGKLTGDKNTDESGCITFDNTMNVRFGYDPRTNYFGRAILRGSGQNQDYLNLHCNNAYSDAACTKQLPYGTSNSSNKFRDISNWVYEREVYVKIDNNNPSASMYIEARSPRNDETVKNHLLGYVINEGTGEETSIPIQKTVIGSGTDNGVYKVRVVYDFKTNRMISVWQPDDIEVSTSKTLHADILFIRKENEPAPQITLTGDGQIKSVESVFFALELTRGDANANRHEEQYMFTLPFDCVVGSISGVPGYMEIWGIQRYRGDLRAQKGWYAETATFWEWMSLTDTLKAGEGYLLAFDKKNANWEEFLEEDLVTKTSLLRLYFPSVQKGFDLKQKSEQQLTVTYKNHPCTLTLHNRYLQDSNWKMIGTTSYNNATVKEYDKNNDPEYEELTEAPSFRYQYSYTFDNNNNRTSYNYTPEDGKTATYKSFYGYMVQFAGTITWNPINETVPEPLAAPRRAQAERSSVTMRLELANTDGEKQDQTFVALDENGTTTFDQNKDLNKIFNSGKPNIYTLSEGIPFAGNTLPMEEVIVPVGVQIATEGEYTFRMPDGTEGMVVELIDYETNTRTNLLLSDYTVNLPAGSNETRFALSIKPEKTATNVGNIGGTMNDGQGVRKFIIDGKLIIRTAEGIFDAQGHRL